MLHNRPGLLGWPEARQPCEPEQLLLERWSSVSHDNLQAIKSEYQSLLTTYSYADVPVNGDPSLLAASLYQEISTASRGDLYYVAVKFSSAAPTGARCHFDFETDREAITRRDYALNDQIPASGTIYASGILTETPILFWMTYSCENDANPPFDAWVSVDYISFTHASGPT